MSKGLILGGLALAIGSIALSGCASQEDIDNAREQAAIEKSLSKVARASQQSRDYAAAARYYQSLHAADPDDVEATLGLARNLRYVGTPARAVQVLERSLSEGAENPRLLAELGRALIAAGEPDRAITPLTEAMTLGTPNWRTLLALGIARDRLGRHAAARISYQSAKTLSPENVAILNNLALSWALDGNLTRATEILERAVKLPSATAQVRQNLALVHGLQGNNERAHELARLDLPEDSAQENLRYYVSLRQGADAKVEAEKVSAMQSGSFSLQIGEFETAEDAFKTWSAMRKEHAELLAAYQIEVFAVTENTKKPFVAWAGPVQTLKLAQAACTALNAQGADCRIVKP